MERFRRRHAWNAPKQNNLKASLSSLYPPTITGFHHPAADPVRRVLAQAITAFIGMEPEDDLTGNPQSAQTGRSFLWPLFASLFLAILFITFRRRRTPYTPVSQANTTTTDAASGRSKKRVYHPRFAPRVVRLTHQLRGAGRRAHRLGRCSIWLRMHQSP